MDPLRINEVNLTEIGPFRKLQLKFQSKPGLSLLCGDNGIGKTTILEAISASFSSGFLNRIKRKQGSTRGNISVLYNISGYELDAVVNVEKFEPEDSDYVVSTVSVCFDVGIHKEAERLIVSVSETELKPCSRWKLLLFQRGSVRSHVSHAQHLSSVKSESEPLIEHRMTALRLRAFVNASQ